MCGCTMPRAIRQSPATRLVLLAAVAVGLRPVHAFGATAWPRQHGGILRPGSARAASPVDQVVSRPGQLPSEESAAGTGGKERGAPGGVWRWRGYCEVYYEVTEGPPGSPPLLLLPGFGVGTFHFERNVQELSEAHTVYTMDLLGQGRSWPMRAPTAEDGLCYSVDTWTQQVADFLHEVVGEPAFLAGNSLGGYLGVNVAARYHDRCRGLAPSPASPPSPSRSSSSSSPSSSWSPPGGMAALVDSLGVWDGTLPPPQALYRLGAYYFDRMRDPATVRTMLGAVYANRGALSEELVEGIVQATERGPTLQEYGVGGHEAFTSILFAPKAAVSFEDMIDAISCPLALVYGREDPWVVPYWGRRIKRQRPDALYYEVSPSGHCPHHETPRTVNALLRGWLAHICQGSAPPLHDPAEESQATAPPAHAADPFPQGESLSSWEFQEVETGVLARATLVGDRPRSALEWIDDQLWALRVGQDGRAQAARRAQAAGKLETDSDTHSHRAPSR